MGISRVYIATFTKMRNEKVYETYLTLLYGAGGAAGAADVWVAVRLVALLPLDGLSCHPFTIFLINPVTRSIIFGSASASCKNTAYERKSTKKRLVFSSKPLQMGRRKKISYKFDTYKANEQNDCFV